MSWQIPGVLRLVLADDRREGVELTGDGVVLGFDGASGFAQKLLELGGDLLACRGLLTAAVAVGGSKACWASMACSMTATL